MAESRFPALEDGQFDVRQTTMEGRRVIEKTGSGRSRGRVRREAAALEQLRSNAVVELVELRETESSTTLVTTYVGARTLADASRLHPAEILRALRETCRVLTDLHRRGWAHGNLTAEHVILGPRSRVRLCSLGDATPLTAEPSNLPGPSAGVGADGGSGNERGDDLGQLVAVLNWLVELPVSGGTFRERREWRRMRSRLLLAVGPARAGTDAHGRATADRIEALADRLAMEKPSRIRGLVFAGGVVAIAVLLLAGFMPGDAGGDQGPPEFPPERTAALREAPADDTASAGKRVAVPRGAPGNFVASDGKIYRIGSEGDQVVIGDWNCDGNRSALVLRPSSGEVFHFRTWAGADRPVESQLIKVIEDATLLRAHGDGCGPAVIEARDGSTHRVEIPAP